jgi:hypothetical protein
VRDRRNGVILIALALTMFVVTARDLGQLDSWRVRVDLALVAVAVMVGLVLVWLGRSR